MLAGGIASSIVSAQFNFCDHLKVRLQVQNQEKKIYKNFLHAFSKVKREEGLRVVFGRGLCASILRDMTYSSIRIGLYDTVKYKLPKIPGTKSKDSLLNKISAAAVTGAIGSSFVNPCDLIKIRQQSVFPEVVQHLNADDTRMIKKNSQTLMPYRNTLDAFVKIMKQDGVAGLYQGIGPTLVRAAVATASQLGAYDHTKHTLLSLPNNQFKDDTKTHFLSAFITSIIMTLCTSPVDVIKSRYMSDFSGEKRLYRSSIHCLTETMKHEGPRALFKGLLPNYIRLSGHCILALPLYEFLRRQFGLTSI